MTQNVTSDRVVPVRRDNRGRTAVNLVHDVEDLPLRLGLALVLVDVRHDFLQRVDRFLDREHIRVLRVFPLGVLFDICDPRHRRVFAGRVSSQKLCLEQGVGDVVVTQSNAY